MKPIENKTHNKICRKDLTIPTIKNSNTTKAVIKEKYLVAEKNEINNLRR